MIVSNKKLLYFFCLLAGILLTSLSFFFWSAPDIGSGFNYAVVVHSADGGELAEFYKERRFFVPHQAIPVRVKEAFLAAEDQRFYSHHGFDIRGILRAFRKNIAANMVVEGGSTITQQLAKMIIKNPERTFSRKFREMIIASQLEWKYSKDEILGAYLNLAYFGERVYGIEAAAKTYFNKSVADLGISEAALLAGLLKAPSSYSPLRNPALARERMKTVLDEMLALHFISYDEYVEALSAPLPEKASFQRKYSAPYFTDFLKLQLSAKYGEALYQQGLQVFSTIDPAMQSLAERVVSEGVLQVELRTKPGAQAALVAIDIATGEVKAMVGGTDYATSQFNRATMALRQPGSAFKPFVYAAAFRKGMSYNDSILDERVRIQELDTGRWWSPRNSEDKYFGEVPLKTAFAHSLNSATVRLAQKIGFDSVLEMAQQCGITTKLTTHPSIALGSFEVTLFELTASYSVIATGRKVVPRAYTMLKNKNGEVVERSVPSSQEVLSADIVDKMRVLLRATIESGIAGRARAVNRLVYGKTGTTNDYSDAWFVGFDDRLALGVWVGRDDHTPLGIEETGSEAALPIWTEFMKHVKY
jgi:penicillin-binding protein 1A